MTVISTSALQRELGERYRIERELGRGGMGVVYQARDLKLDRLIALKVLPEEYAADTALRARFLLETRTAASFSHPNIVPVHAIVERPRLIAYSMGFVEGESVSQRVARSGPLTVREIVRLLQDVGYALAYAHGRGVVHRDIKPENIMLERATGRALLMDFGISRVMENRAAAGLTRVGEVVGTPEYMSPEQAAGDTVDGRSDLYSLGLVAWYAITGRTAMTGETTQKILVKQLTEPVPRVESVRPDLPDLLSQAIDRCIETAPDDRFATAEALVEAVDDAQLAGPEIPLPVRIFTQELGTMSLLVVFIALLGWYTVRTLGARMSMIDAYLPVVILFSVGLTRVHQTLSDARRLAVAGFTRDEILKGMRGVVDERESLREALRGDAETRTRRRRTLVIAVVQLAGAAALIWFAMQLRVQIAPQQFRAPLGAVVMVVSAMCMIGISGVLIARSPIRMPVGERAFRRVWLGPVGRVFLAAGARGVRRDPGGAVPAMSIFVRSTPTSRGAGEGAASRSAAVTSAAVTLAAPSGMNGVAGNGVGSGGDAVARLERRIEALEAWRREGEGEGGKV
ncbi:MAG: serine/threonine protein kinase [Gemmatimonadaceae bacterium]|nr:serine/threonine protein kinase [Gemmatimonadaceae bacterium]